MTSLAIIMIGKARVKILIEADDETTIHETGEHLAERLGGFYLYSEPVETF